MIYLIYIQLGQKSFFCSQFQQGTLTFTSAKPSTTALFGSGGKSWKKVQEEELF